MEWETQDPEPISLPDSSQSDCGLSGWLLPTQLDPGHEDGAEAASDGDDAAKSAGKGASNGGDGAKSADTGASNGADAAKKERFRSRAWLLTVPQCIVANLHLERDSLWERIKKTFAGCDFQKACVAREPGKEEEEEKDSDFNPCEDGLQQWPSTSLTNVVINPIIADHHFHVAVFLKKKVSFSTMLEGAKKFRASFNCGLHVSMHQEWASALRYLTAVHDGKEKVLDSAPFLFGILQSQIHFQNQVRRTAVEEVEKKLRDKNLGNKGGKKVDDHDLVKLAQMENCETLSDLQKACLAVGWERVWNNHKAPERVLKKAKEWVQLGAAEFRDRLEGLPPLQFLFESIPHYVCTCTSSSTKCFEHGGRDTDGDCFSARFRAHSALNFPHDVNFYLDALLSCLLSGRGKADPDSARNLFTLGESSAAKSYYSVDALECCYDENAWGPPEEGNFRLSGLSSHRRRKKV